MSLDPDGVADPEPTNARDPPELSMTVVEYTDEPDRCTVSPRGLSGSARLSTWITVNQSVVVDLTAIR